MRVVGACAGPEIAGAGVAESEVKNAADVNADVLTYEEVRMLKRRCVVQVCWCKCCCKCWCCCRGCSCCGVTADGVWSIA